MGQVQTHVEAKVFDDAAPPWDVKEVTACTDLDENTVNACWRMWVDNPLVRKGQMRERDFYQLLGFAEEGTEEALEQAHDKRQAMKLFQLLDTEDDDKLEFPDLMVFLFAMDPLDADQKLRRSYLLCDKNRSGKISKEEMVEVLDKLEVLDMEHDDKGRVIIPDNVENLFSLMDFAHDKKISQEEFLKATRHYRKLGSMMTISLMEPRRLHLIDLIKDFMEREEKEKEEKEEEEAKKGKGKKSKGRMGSQQSEEEQKEK